MIWRRNVTQRCTLVRTNTSDVNPIFRCTFWPYAQHATSVLESPAYNPNTTNPKPNPTYPTNPILLTLTLFEHLAKSFYAVFVNIAAMHSRYILFV